MYFQTHAHIIDNQWGILTPMSSTNILSSPTGPKELLTMLAMEDAAMTVRGKLTKKQTNKMATNLSSIA